MDVEVLSDRISSGEVGARDALLSSFTSLGEESRDRLLDALGSDAAAGNPHALRALIEVVDRHRLDRPGLRRILVREDDIEEAHQDVLVALAQSISGFRGESALRTWLFAVARNTAASHLRRAQRTPLPVEVVDEPMTGQRLSSMISVRADLQAAVESLPGHYRDAVFLRDVEQRPYDQISDLLGVPMNTVKSRINRGRALVAAALTEAL